MLPTTNSDVSGLSHLLVQVKKQRFDNNQLLASHVWVFPVKVGLQE